MEDEDTGYKILKSMLERTKARILKARDGLEAVNVFKSNQDIDLILMDIKLPVMDGIEAEKEIKRIRKDVYIIAQTAYALEDEEREIMKSGFDAYLAKPLISDKVLKTLKKYLS